MSAGKARKCCDVSGRYCRGTVFLCAEITLDSLDDLNQDGVQGSELFDGFELPDREHAEQIFRTGRDGHWFFTISAWMVLSIFLSLFP